MFVYSKAIEDVLAELAAKTPRDITVTKATGGASASLVVAEEQARELAARPLYVASHGGKSKAIAEPLYWELIGASCINGDHVGIPAPAKTGASVVTVSIEPVK